MIPPITYDGRHLLADLYGCPVLDDVALIDAALRGAARWGGGGGGIRKVWEKMSGNFLGDETDYTPCF